MRTIIAAILIFFSTNAFSQADSAYIGNLITGGYIPTPSPAAYSQLQQKLSWITSGPYSITSSGTGSSINMGNHYFCALTQVSNTWHEQANQCYITGTILTARGDPSVQGGRGATCSATCWDIVVN